MKLSDIFCILVLMLLNSGQANAQINLPVDANNCAIFNALNYGTLSKCTQTSDLGISRGLIVHMTDNGSVANAQQTVIKLPTAETTVKVKEQFIPSKIDYKAAKSETGYYIHFAFNSETLEKEYRDHLERLVIVLNSPSMKTNCVKITGHTDTIGKSNYNIGLSDRRAKSVYRYLISLDNIDKNRFTLAAAGENHPLPGKKGTSPYNRRVEFSSRSGETGCQLVN